MRVSQVVEGTNEPAGWGHIGTGKVGKGSKESARVFMEAPATEAVRQCCSLGGREAWPSAVGSVKMLNTRTHSHN